MKPCKNMQEIRQKIDTLDQQLVPLLVERIGCVRQAAHFKARVEDVRLPDRIEEIIKKIRTSTAAQSDSIEFIEAPDFIEALYRYMIDRSIEEETKCWKDLNKAQKKS